MIICPRGEYGGKASWSCAAADDALPSFHEFREANLAGSVDIKTKITRFGRV